MHQILRSDAKKIVSAIDDPSSIDDLSFIFSDGMYTSFKLLKDKGVFFTPLEGHSVSGCMAIKRYVLKPDNILWLVGDVCSATLKVVDTCSIESRDNFWITDDEIRSISEAIKGQESQYIDGGGGWTFINGTTPVIEFNDIKFGFNHINIGKNDITFFHKDHRLDYMIFVKKPTGKLK